MHNTTKRQEFLRLRSLGESFDKISAKIGISKPTLLKWSNDFAYELSQAKLKILDNIIEEYNVGKSGRLRIIAEEITRLDVELNKRDLASIPTSKLLQIKLKALEVAGNILDVKRIELGGSVEIEDTMSRWERIMSQCVKPKEIDNGKT